MSNKDKTQMVDAVTTKELYAGTVVEKETKTPMENVSVSDGRNVVKTDQNGYFELKGYSKTRFIMVTAPTGYTTEEYYIPAGKRSGSYNFTLSKSCIPAGGAHSFLQISDTEIGQDGVGPWIQYIKKIVNEKKPAFLVHTGDICYEAGLRRHIHDMNSENMGLPVRYVIGNHDYVDGEYGEELFESIYGPVWYSFEVGNVHYVVTPFQNGADRESGYDQDDRWRWLENDLKNTAPGMKVVVLNHNKPESSNYVMEFDQKSLDLKKYNLIAWVHGHYHYNYVQNNNGILNISTARPDCGGIDSSASGSRIISIDTEGKISTRMRYYDFVNEQAKIPTTAKFVSQLAGNILFTNPVYADGKIFTATVGDDWPRDCGVYAINADDGHEIWNYKTINSIKNNIVVNGGKVYAQDCEGHVYCFEQKMGKLLWHTPVQIKSGFCTSNGIVLDGGKLYAGCAAVVTCLDAGSGTVLWETNDRKRGLGSPAGFIIAGNKLIVSSQWDALIALDKNSGRTLWENCDSDIRFRSSTPIQIDSDTLLVADAAAIMLVDLATGEIKNKTTVEDYQFDVGAQPAVMDGIAYIPTSNKGMLAYSLTDDKQIWHVETAPAIVYTSPYKRGNAQIVEGTPVIDGSRLWFGGADGVIYCLNKANGAIVKTVDIGAPIFGKLAVTGDSVYAADFAGRVLKIEK